MHSVATKFSKGFTIVEIVVVITVLGIMSALAMPRFFDVGTFNERGFYDELVSAVRYGRNLAVASGCPVRVALTVNAYALQQRATCDAADFSNAVNVNHPSRFGAFSATAPSGVTISPATTITFDAMGRADNGYNIAVGGRSFTIVAESGYVVTP